MPGLPGGTDRWSDRERILIAARAPVAEEQEPRNPCTGDDMGW